MEICIIMNYKTVLDLNVTKKQILIGGTLLIATTILLISIPTLLIAKPIDIPEIKVDIEPIRKIIIDANRDVDYIDLQKYYDYVREQLAKCYSKSQTRSLYDIYIRDIYEAFKLKLQLDNIPEAKAINELIKKYPIKVYPMPR